MVYVTKLMFLLHYAQCLQRSVLSSGASASGSEDELCIESWILLSRRFTVFLDLR